MCVFGCAQCTWCQIIGLYGGILALVIWKYSFYIFYTSQAVLYCMLEDIGDVFIGGKGIPEINNVQSPIGCEDARLTHIHISDIN